MEVLPLFAGLAVIVAAVWKWNQSVTLSEDDQETLKDLQRYLKD